MYGIYPRHARHVYFLDFPGLCATYISYSSLLFRRRFSLCHTAQGRHPPRLGDPRHALPIYSELMPLAVRGTLLACWDCQSLILRLSKTNPKSKSMIVISLLNSSNSVSAQVFRPSLEAALQGPTLLGTLGILPGEQVPDGCETLPRTTTDLQWNPQSASQVYSIRKRAFLHRRGLRGLLSNPKGAWATQAAPGLS